jgi:Cytochrome bd terminal oxidase subunit I
VGREETQTVHYGIQIPKLLSFLAHGDFDSEVKGLDQFPREHWPPVAVTHMAFQIMVGIGTLLAVIGGVSLFALWKKLRWLRCRRALRLFAVCTPLGFIAIEAGWTVTEVGRQPSRSAKTLASAIQVILHFWFCYGQSSHECREGITRLPLPAAGENGEPGATSCRTSSGRKCVSGPIGTAFSHPKGRMKTLMPQRPGRKTSVANGSGICGRRGDNPAQ